MADPTSADKETARRLLEECELRQPPYLTDAIASALAQARAEGRAAGASEEREDIAEDCKALAARFKDGTDLNRFWLTAERNVRARAGGGERP